MLLKCGMENGMEQKTECQVYLFIKVKFMNIISLLKATLTL